ncbi:RNA 2',3'-cyclic phosphodiesterase [Fodinibius sediminis]|uniref:RNA 2',3'-cyclic phosphodiesterase n=1 Tax=Fodinibius sediminis TaxID=1214077 RepID=A0A521C4M9_9BACT|nr:RNA 2',3'-cyclic phosphodiesterase [Fodinibius sediminis]SMO54402.1 2'-5' RNA ligase [Fodinibius sediminis]
MRLFIAIPLPEDVRQQLAALRGPIDGVRWQSGHQMHLTLKFLGDTSERDLPPLIEQLNGIHQQAFKLVIKGFGCFPRRGRPKVLWAGVSKSTKLRKLQRRVEETTIAAGFQAENRPYVPHITIGRTRGGNKREVMSFINQHKKLMIPGVPVSEFVLYESRLNAGGATHEQIKRFPLGT